LDRAAPPTDPTIHDRVVAVVNNDAITLGEIQEAIVHYRQEQRGRGPESDEELARQFLNRLIDTRLQLQEAERERILVDDAEIREEMAELAKKMGAASLQAFEEMAQAQGISPEALRKRTRERLRLAKVVRRKVTLRISVTEAEIDRYLEANRAKLETGLAYHARHIVVVPEGTSDAAWERARAQAEAVRAEAAAGADFAGLARQHSRDPTARDGGDLGTLKRGELAQDIEARILALAPGEISPPHRSRLGWHLFRLESKEVLEGEALARVRQQIRDILFREKYDSRLEAWLNELKARAIIDVRL
jgi:peptidyl-prolyl cis-trans isomerase SurA